MAKFNKSIFLLSLILVSFFAMVSFAKAATPTLSVSSTGSGDNVQINVSGADPSASVLLFAGSQMPVLGTTDASGNFSIVISSAAYNISPNSAAYIKTGGINGSMSNQVIWPYFQSTTTSSLTLSQTALLLNIGQTSTVTASANYLYVQSNSNPSIANINLNASTITITANTYGSTVANICIVGSTTNCASLTTTVQNSGAQQLSFSQNNFSIVSGQSIPVTVTGGSGVYTISNNSNSSAVQANLNGSTVTLYANNTTGSSAITVCTTDMNNCGIINVSATTVNSTSVSFSQTNPVVPLGQSTTVTIYGGTGGNFYVSSNSNPSLVQANINGNILTLIGNATTGTSTISVCAYAGSCASLTANVSNVSSGGTISLSQNSISILAGQSSSITISGGSTPYSVSSSNSANIFNSSITGNVLTIYGVNQGTATANICASVGCTTLSVTINNINSTVNPPTFSQNNILLNINQQTTVYISGNSNYYVANNTSPAVATISISGNSATITGSNAGSSNISICQNGGQCATLYITVSAPTTITTPVVTPVVTTPVITFLRYLGFGDKGDDVLKLQQVLVKLGFLTATPNGHFGAATKTAVKKFQKAHSINQTGNMGPSTKNLLNQLEAGSTSTSSAMSVSQIQQAISQLQAQLSALPH